MYLLLAAGFCERGLQAGAMVCEAKDVRFNGSLQIVGENLPLMDSKYEEKRPNDELN
jgi:hypothetical protein